MQANGELGRVTVAPEVLLTIVRQTTLSVDGVARLYATWPENIGKLFGIHTATEGIGVQIENEELIIDVHIVADPEAQMVELGRELQREISRSIEEIVGLNVRAVNVHIEDVDVGSDSDEGVA